MQIILLLFAILFGIIFSLILGVATIKLKADHTISGVALNLLAVAVAAVIVNSPAVASASRTIAYNPNINLFHINAN
ncbi:UNVERIFIED_CONTAM: hypothetical protein O8I53_05700 [Campylobacter lari]